MWLRKELLRGFKSAVWIKTDCSGQDRLHERLVLWSKTGCALICRAWNPDSAGTGGIVEDDW